MDEIVKLLGERGPMKTSEIAEILGISPQSVYYHLKRLELKGLVARIGGSKGRGHSAVWKLKQRKTEENALLVEVSLIVGKALGWINSQRERDGDAWSFIGIKREAVTTTMALLLNAEIEGKSLPLPSQLSLETSKRILAKEAEIEYYTLLSRYYYLVGEKRRLQRSIKKLSKLLPEIIEMSNITFELLASFIILMTKPFFKLLDDDIANLLVDHIKKDVKEVSRIHHWETALGWMTLARLELGMRKEAYKLYRELLPRLEIKKDEAFLEDEPPLYLIRLYGLDRATLDPTTIMFVLSRRFGNENLSKKLLRHIIKHQTPEGAFVVSQELGPDLARTEIVTYLLWYSLSSIPLSL